MKKKNPNYTFKNENEFKTKTDTPPPVIQFCRLSLEMHKHFKHLHWHQIPKTTVIKLDAHYSFLVNNKTSLNSAMGGFHPSQ